MWTRYCDLDIVFECLLFCSLPITIAHSLLIRNVLMFDCRTASGQTSGQKECGEASAYELTSATLAIVVCISDLNFRSRHCLGEGANDC